MLFPNEPYEYGSGWFIGHCGRITPGWRASKFHRNSGVVQEDLLLEEGS